MKDEQERTRVAAATLRSVGGFVAPALLVGLALPLHRGLGLPLLVVAAVLAVRTLRAASTGVYASAPMPARVVLFVLTVFPIAVILTVGARAVAAVVIAYPAALWCLPIVLASAVLARMQRAALPLALVLAALVPIAGVIGTRWEAGADDARGWMMSGPIHGIHPGQTTALVVDGYGPFDLPINDYVEPTGGRGYDPEAFAALIEESLHRIADVHYAHGPARARMAFANAEAEAIVTEAVEERLGRNPGATEHPRFIVRSGTTGQRSRVEFVCPGRRDDPRGHRGENVMNRNCPTKYASEASAGLGVTGRWPGYAEGRGNERLGLAHALGWTRSDDAAGRDVLTREHRWIAWLAIAALAGLVALPRARAAAGVSMLAGAVGVGALALVLAIAFAGDGASMQVNLVESPRGGIVDDSLVAWLPALLLLGGIPAIGLDRDHEGDAASQGEHWSARIGAFAIAVVVLLLATHLSALDFVAPQLYGEVDGELALQRFIAGAAEAMGERFGLTILEVEGAIASAIVAGLLGGLAHALRVAGHAAHGLQPSRAGLWGIVVVALTAAAVVVSRKTLGGAALMPGAIGLTLVLHGGLQVLSARPRRFALPLLVGSVLVALVCIWHGAASVDPHPFVLLCAVAGGLAALASLALPILARPKPGA